MHINVASVPVPESVVSMTVPVSVCTTVSMCLTACLYACVYVHDYVHVTVYVHVYVYEWASLVAQMVKSLPTVRETWVRSLGWEDALEKEMATHSSILAEKIPW